LTESTLADPVNKMIAKGIPVISIDTFIAPYDTVNVHTRLTPDNNFMGTSVTQPLVDALNGEGNKSHDNRSARILGGSRKVESLRRRREAISEDGDVIRRGVSTPIGAKNH
jgi:ABC-type sugar transport system substrate-binding protein